MLILGRQVGQVVNIGPSPTGGTVEVVEVHGDKVRLGFHYPRDVVISRPDAKSSGDRPLPRLSAVEPASDTRIARLAAMYPTVQGSSVSRHIHELIARIELERKL